MQRRFLAGALVIMVFVFPAIAEATRPSLRGVLGSPVAHYDLQASNLLEAISRISSEFDIPTGIEWYDSVNVERPINLERRNVSVEQILRDVVATDPSYELDVSTEVVHVRPVGFATRPDNYLNIVVPSFAVTDLYTISAANKLRGELQAMLVPRPARPPQEGCAGSVGVGALEVRTTLDLTKATVRAILDKLLVNSEYLMWLVVFKNGLKENGYLVSASIWRESSRTEQPDWAFVDRFFNPVERKERADWRLHAASQLP